MPFRTTLPFDPTTPLGTIRVLLPDVDEDNVIFVDEELQAFLTIESNSIRRATALALETLATNEAYVQKVVKLWNLSTDGAKTADFLLKRATKLREQALEDEAREDTLFDYAELGYEPFGVVRRWVNEWKRGRL